MPTVPFVRVLNPPSSPKKSEGGQDVVAVKRGISRAGYWPWQPFDDIYSEAFAHAVRAFRQSKKLTASLVYDEKTHNALANTKAVDYPGEYAFDATAILMLQQEKRRTAKSPAQQKAEDLLAYCKQFDDGYCYGGEHDGSVLDDSPHACFDCSSSTSAALAHVGLLGSTVAHVSGWFKTWGLPGRGQYVTVHAADDHVWIEFTIPGLSWCRFDTSPHGCGSSGPRVRTCMRDMDRFVSRHPSGL